jgi:hypothetical protein
VTIFILKSESNEADIEIQKITFENNYIIIIINNNNNNFMNEDHLPAQQNMYLGNACENSASIDRISGITGHKIDDRSVHWRNNRSAYGINPTHNFQELLFIKKGRFK